MWPPVLKATVVNVTLVSFHELSLFTVKLSIQNRAFVYFSNLFNEDLPINHLIVFKLACAFYTTSFPLVALAMYSAF